MKTNEEYLDAYLDKYNYLKKKNELWRLRVTPQQFLSERLKKQEKEVKMHERKNIGMNIIFSETKKRQFQYCSWTY